MSIIIGTNSWGTVEEADLYLENKMNAEDWFLLDETALQGAKSKTTVLVTAYYEIQSSTMVTVPHASPDNNLKNAQFEMALFILKFYEEIYERRASIASGLSEIKTSKIIERYDQNEGGGNVELPANVIGLLEAYTVAAELNTTVELQG